MPLDVMSLGYCTWNASIKSASISIFGLTRLPVNILVLSWLIMFRICFQRARVPHLLLRFWCTCMAALQCHIQAWHMYYSVLSRFQWISVYADMLKLCHVYGKIFGRTRKRLLQGKLRFLVEKAWISQMPHDTVHCSLLKVLLMT